MMNEPTIHEHVSALADGQLQGEEFGRVVEALCTQDELRARWQTYHLVGDVLRSGRHLPCSDTTRFVARLQQRLAAEPAAPRRGATAPMAVQPFPQPLEAANEPVFRWKLVAGVASLAAAAAIGWNWVGSGAAAPSGAQLAQQRPAQDNANSVLAAAEPSPRAPAPTRVVVGSGSGGGAPQVMLRDARLDAMLAAHQQAGGASQMPSGFMRNATFEGPSR